MQVQWQVKATESLVSIYIKRGEQVFDRLHCLFCRFSH